MFKSVFAATAALSMSAGAALATSVPYVNVEANASWAGDDYISGKATTDIHEVIPIF